MALCIYRKPYNASNHSSQVFSMAFNPGHYGQMKSDYTGEGLCVSATRCKLIFFWLLKYNFMTIFSLTANLSMKPCQKDNITGQMWTYDAYNNTNVKLHNSSSSCLILILQFYPLLIALTNSKLGDLYCFTVSSRSTGSFMYMTSCNPVVNNSRAGDEDQVFTIEMLPDGKVNILQKDGY